MQYSAILRSSFISESFCSPYPGYRLFSFRSFCATLGNVRVTHECYCTGTITSRTIFTRCKLQVFGSFSSLSRALHSWTLYQNVLLKECFSGTRVKEADALMIYHGRNILQALLYGVASVAPRSTLQNMSEILTQLSSKRTVEVKAWANEILFSVGLQDHIQFTPG